MDHSTNFKFPFHSVLNLRLLIEYWENSIQQGQIPGFGQGLLNSIAGAPELREPIYDLSIIEKHRPLVNFLMTAVIPPANHATEISAAILPFDFKSLYSTPAFDK